jgi:hypothetical protein
VLPRELFADRAGLFMVALPNAHPHVTHRLRPARRSAGASSDGHDADLFESGNQERGIDFGPQSGDFHRPLGIAAHIVRS